MKNYLAFAFAILLPHVTAAQQTVDGGQEAFNNHCRTCHVSKPGENRLGPSLAGVVGRKAGTSQNYAYSDAMKNSGLTWDEASLDKFIADPDALVQSNKMKPFNGVSDAAERAKIISFLKKAQ